MRAEGMNGNFSEVIRSRVTSRRIIVGMRGIEDGRMNRGKNLRRFPKSPTFSSKDDSGRTPHG